MLPSVGRVAEGAHRAVLGAEPVAVPRRRAGDRDDGRARRPLVAVEVRVAVVQDAAAGGHHPVAQALWRRAHVDDGLAQPPAGRRSVRLRVTEAEHAARRVRHPVALAGRRRDDRDDRVGEVTLHRSVRLRVTEAEHAARRVHQPIALAGRRCRHPDDRAREPLLHRSEVRRVAEGEHAAARADQPHSGVRRRGRARDDRRGRVRDRTELDAPAEAVHPAVGPGQPVALLRSGPRRRGTRGEQRQAGVRATEQRGRVGMQPRAQHVRVQLAEVDGRYEVAVVVELREARLRAVVTALDVVADHEDRRRGAVVGARVAVLLGPAPEFRERHQRDLRTPPGIERGVEELDRGVETAHERRVPVDLVGVRVESVEPGVEHADAQVGIDEVRGQHELLRDVGVLRVEPVRGADPLCELHELHLVVVVEVTERSEPRRAVAHRDERVVHAGVGRVRSVDAERVIDVERQGGCLRDGTGEVRVHTAVQPDAVQRLARGVGQSVEVPAEPAVRRRARPTPAVHPDVGRREVAEVGRLVPDPPHDRDVTLVEPRLERGERRVQREAVTDREPVGDLDRRPQRGVRGVTARDDHVHAVVAAAQEDRDEDALVVGDGRRRERWRASRGTAPARRRRPSSRSPAGTAGARRTGGRTRSGQARLISGLSNTRVSRLTYDQ